MGCTSSKPEHEERRTLIPKRDRTFKFHDSSCGLGWEVVSSPQLGITRYMPFRDTANEIQFNGQVGKDFVMGAGIMIIKDPRGEHLVIEISASITRTYHRKSPYLTTYGIYWGRNSSHNRNMVIPQHFGQSTNNAMLCALESIMSLLLEETQVATGKNIVINTTSEFMYNVFTDYIYRWHDQSDYRSHQGQKVAYARRYERVHKAIHELWTSKGINVRFQHVEAWQVKGAERLAQLAQESPATFPYANELPTHPHLPWEHANDFARLYVAPDAEIKDKFTRISSRMEPRLTRDNPFMDSFISFLICGVLLSQPSQVDLPKYFNKKFGVDWKNTIKSERDKLRKTLTKLKLDLDVMRVTVKQGPDLVANHERSAEIGKILQRIEKEGFCT